MIPAPDPTLVSALAADLAAAGYTGSRLLSMWGVSADESLARGQALPARRALRTSESAVSVLARLFVLGCEERVADVDAALASLTVAGAEKLGLVRLTGDSVSPLVLIRTQAYVDERGAGEWWVASDLDESVRVGRLREDHVLGVGRASLTLAGLQLPTPAGRVWDLGTGCGIQALRASRNSLEVIATDVSESALRFARFNALLNAVEGIRTRRGSLFEPIADEQFDRIVTNPPFVITPRGTDVPAYEYRDGGATGDDLVRELVMNLGAHLTPGGTAQLLANWEYGDGEDGLARVRDWVGLSPIPLDAWVIERERVDPIAYAELWIRDGGTIPGSPDFEAMLTAWLDDFSARSVTGVGFGYILLRRPLHSVTLARFERVSGAVGSHNALGAHMADCLRAHDRQAMLTDDELADTVLIVAGDVTEARHHVPGAEDPSVIELHQGGGFGRTVDVDPALAALVGACDGDLPVGRLIVAIAELLDVDAASLLRELLPRVRELLDDGFVVFAGDEESGPASHPNAAR